MDQQLYDRPGQPRLPSLPALVHTRAGVRHADAGQRFAHYSLGDKISDGALARRVERLELLSRPRRCVQRGCRWRWDEIHLTKRHNVAEHVVSPIDVSLPGRYTASISLVTPAMPHVIAAELGYVRFHLCSPIPMPFRFNEPDNSSHVQRSYAIVTRWGEFIGGLFTSYEPYRLCLATPQCSRRNVVQSQMGLGEIVAQVCHKRRGAFAHVAVRPHPKCDKMVKYHRVATAAGYVGSHVRLSGYDDMESVHDFKITAVVKHQSQSFISRVCDGLHSAAQQFCEPLRRQYRGISLGCFHLFPQFNNPLMRGKRLANRRHPMFRWLSVSESTTQRQYSTVRRFPQADRIFSLRKISESCRVSIMRCAQFSPELSARTV